MLVLASLNSFGYKLFFLLHILAIIVAFAPAFVWPFVAARSRRGGLDSASLAREAAANSRMVHGPALALAGIFGFGLIGLSDKIYKFSQAWVSLAFLLWIIMLGVVFGLLGPAERQAAEGDEDAMGRVSMFGGIMHLLLFLMLIDMIWKPGFP